MIGPTAVPRRDSLYALYRLVEYFKFVTRFLVFAMGKRGPASRIIYTRTFRVALTEAERDMVPFFKELERLPRGKRNAVHLAAIRGGAASAFESVASSGRESQRASAAIDALLGEL